MNTILSAFFMLSLTTCCWANDFYSSVWLRNYPDPEKGESWRLVVDGQKNLVRILSNRTVELLNLPIQDDLQLFEVVVNEEGSKAAVSVGRRGSSPAGHATVFFEGANGSLASIDVELSKKPNRIFISEIASISQSGRYLICQCGIYEERLGGFVVLYRWKVLDLFSEGKIVGNGVDDWAKFVGQ